MGKGDTDCSEAALKGDEEKEEGRHRCHLHNALLSYANKLQQRVLPRRLDRSPDVFPLPPIQQLLAIYRSYQIARSKGVSFRGVAAKEGGRGCLWLLQEQKRVREKRHPEDGRERREIPRNECLRFNSLPVDLRVPIAAAIFSNRRLSTRLISRI